jgi:tetratricopeptide (TPR) repeat protein
MKALIGFIVITIWGFIYVLPSAFAQEHSFQQQFEKANEAYESQHYTEAAAAYQQLMDSGFKVADLYFNAGNAYFKANQIPNAIYCFEMAQLLAPGNAHIDHNLALAQARINHNVAALPLLFFQKWWLQLQRLHTAHGWAVWSLIWVWILAILLYGYFLWDRSKGHPYIRVGMSVVGFLGVLYISMAFWTHYKAFNSEHAIVMHTSMTYEAPDQEAKTLFEVREGLKVQILDATQQFTKIRLTDGKEGWIEGHQLKALNFRKLVSHSSNRMEVL